jgi:hypothetical protein
MGQKLDKAPKGSYDAIVYIEGSEVVAEDSNGRKIASGVAGTDVSSVFQAVFALYKKVHVKHGIYIANGLTAGDLMLSGDGIGPESGGDSTNSTILQSSGAGNLLSLSSLGSMWGSTIKDIGFCGVTGTNNLLQINNIWLPKIDGIKFYGVFEKAIVLTGSSYHADISRSRFSGHTVRGIDVESNGFNIHGCDFAGANGAIDIYPNTVYGYITQNWFERAVGRGGYSIRDVGACVLDIGGNHFLDISDGALGTSVYVTGASRITNNYFTEAQKMIECDVATAPYPIIANNIFSSPIEQYIHIITGLASIENNRFGLSSTGTITSCVTGESGTGYTVIGNVVRCVGVKNIYFVDAKCSKLDANDISGIGAASARIASALNNTVSVSGSNTLTGIAASQCNSNYVSGTQYGISTDVMAMSNVIVNVLADGIRTSSAGAMIKNNYVSGAAACGINVLNGYTILDGNKVINGATGIYIPSTKTNCVLFDNYVDANSSSNYSITAVLAMVRDNFNYVLKNFGSSTGTGVEQTIAHGLAAIPTGCKAWITYQDAGGDYITEFVRFNATNIKVTLDAGIPYTWGIGAI